MKPKTSDIWHYFVEAGENYVKCNICFKNYSNKGRSTTPLKGHLKSMHKEQYEEFCKLEEQRETVGKTPSVVTPSAVTPSQHSGRQKTSDIWQYFEEIDDNFAKCQICFNNYSRKGRTTSSLRGHLRSMHKEKYKELCEVEEQVMEILVEEIPSESIVAPSQQTVKHRTSKIWHYFEEIDENLAECQVCFKNYSRKNRSITALKMHLKSMHKEKYEELCEMEEQREIVEIELPSTATQEKKKCTKEESRKKSQMWDTSHAVSKKMDDLIGEMIALHNVPFNFVEGIGFQRLMQMVMPNYQLRGRQFFTDHICEEIYPKMARKIGELLKRFPKLSFTTDTCSEPLANVSLLGLTAHGITEDFTRMQVLLKCCSPYSRHTGDVVCHNFRMMLLEWDIQDEQLHCFIRDGGSNRVRAVHLASKISEVNCTVHGLQLCLRTALENNELKNLIGKCNRIAGHFKYSQIAQDELIQIQTEQLNEPALHVIQDCVTRWNSTFHMIERLLEIKNSICLYTSNHNIPQFSSNEWWCLSKLVAILKPFEEVTTKFCEKQSCISSVIPLIHTLKHSLQIEKEKPDTNLCFKNMIKELIEDINLQFGDLSSNTLYSLATYLDPRYKFKFFNEITKKQVQSEVLRLLSLHDLSLQSAREDNEDGASAAKRSRTESNLIDDKPSTSAWQPMQNIDSKLANLLKHDEDDDDDDDDEDDRVDKTVKTKSKEKIWKSLLNDYNKENILPLNEDPLMWWKYNTKFHALAPIVRTYLSPPPGSVPSEQLIDEAGLNYESLTNNLEDDKTSELLFVKYNLPLLNFDY